ncbi:TonB-dependent receptor [Shewanella abyssi]|uniref:TonB-dependent receptor plug domain-containing protein n=1 Tax=Shewanella abyssi TaxID=311789 RepID=UPI00200CEE8D|nr:TonB-dependent receptor [Shewanella abyssi]MCL1051186.1 TonB-dependent receptor [Shewanella abyssi]
MNLISLGIAIAVGGTSFTLVAQEDNSIDVVEEEIEVIQVTGSRIGRTDMEGVDPVVVLSADDIVTQGHANVFDALNSLAQNTGQFIGEENSNNFNANAQAINLRGFGAGYTLTLINGRRIPVLPKPSGGLGGNVVNLAMIPTEAVKRVEILSGGASAIYGSDAVAGVVNVILKDDIDYTQATVRFGDTKDGGGQSKKFTFSTGGQLDKLSYTAIIEVDQRDPIYGDDRDWFDEPTDGPDASRHGLPQVMSYWTRYQPKSWMLNDLSGRCENLGYQDVQPGWIGEDDAFDPDPYYCGDNVYDTYTIRNARDNVSAFVNLDYELDDGRLFATLIGTQSSADAGIYRYSFDANYDVRTDINDSSTWQGSRHVYRQFRNFEVPTSNQEFDESVLIGIVGIEGVIADEFDYSVTFTGSQYDYKDSVVRLDDQKMLSLMFGEKGVDWDQPWDGDRWVVVNASQLNDNFEPNSNIDFFGQLTPDMFEDALHTSVGEGDSYLYSLAFDLVGTMFELPAGDLQFAFVGEYTKEGYKFDTDEKTVQGEIFGWSGITGEGDRDRYAVGLELAVPLADSDSSIGYLEAKLAGRYDYYDDESDVGGAFTYQTGLSWRPIDELLVRGSYATSFRAPDMHYMYAGESSSFVSSTDYLTCVQDEGLTSGQGWGDCSDDYGTGSIRQNSQGDLSLEEETGDSLNIGIVADITDDWSVTADYYEISLEKKVGTIGASTVLRYEAECTVGFDQYGNSIDPNSAKCQEMLSRVSRGGARGGVKSIVTSPFNTGVREQKGMDLSSSYTYEFDRFGSIFFNLNYTHIFETNEKYLPEDELEDIRDAQWNTEFRTHTTGTLGWYNDDLAISLFANRLGSSPVRWSEDENERYDAWTRVNLNTSYQIMDELSITASVVNLFDEKPPQHESEKWWPFADISKYNAVGMEYFVTMSYKFY